MNSLTQAFHNISNTISHTLYDATGSLMGAMQANKLPTTYTVDDIVSLEEAERARRIQQASSSDVARKNAAHSAQLIHNASLPFNLAKNRGMKRMTRESEERERSRRLASKPDIASRKVNANLISGKVTALGWPFIRTKSGPHYTVASETSLLEEEERQSRMENPLATRMALHNARQVSNAIRWGYTGLPLGSKRFSRMLENKERTRRLADQDEHVRSAEGAYQQAGIIRALGYPFFKQGVHHDDTLSLELQEQARRLADKDEQIRARQHANVVSRLLPVWTQGKSNARADQEKVRRLSDVDEQQRSMEHAHQISALIAGINTDKDIEHERQRRMKPYHSAYEQEMSKFIANMIHGIQFTKKDANSLYEKEARRRLRDISNERIARRNATKVASLISASDAFKGWDHRVEEAERKDRMYDRPLQRQAMKNARMVSNLIKKRATTVPEVSMPRSVPSDYLPPAQTLQTALPFQSELLEKRPQNPPATSLPFAEELLNRAPTSSTPAAPESFDHSHSLPFESELLEKRPVAPPATSLPFTEELLHRAPMSSTPASKSAPTSSAPVSTPSAIPTFESAAQPTRDAPMMLPAQPSYSAPMMSSTLPLAPLYAAPYESTSYSSVPIYSALTVTAPVMPATGTYYSAAGSHVLSEPQQRRLEKQALRHNKRAARENKKAEKDIRKAEKLHTKGKENRAVKHESKAEQHVIASKQHALWANDLLTKNATYVPIASAPVAGRSAM